MEKRAIKIGNHNVEVTEDGSEVYVDGYIKRQNLLAKTMYKQVIVGMKRFYTHRLVAMAFHVNTNPISHKFVIHVDGDVANNHYSNLKWATHKQLTEVQVLNRSKNPYSRNVGRRSKIKDEDIPGIVERLNNGEKGRVIAREFDTSEMSINRIRKRYCEVKTISKKYPLEVKDIVLQFFKKGTESTIISTATGIPYHTIYKWRKAFDKGVFPTPPGVVLGLNGQPLKHGKRRAKNVE